MNIIFCEECGSRNVIEDKALQNIGTKAFPCQVCDFPISTEHLINHTGAHKVIDTSTYKLLIVDDDLAHLNLLKASLQNEYAVSVASSGDEGIATATSQEPDLILLDVSMPGMDGYQVCTKLKGNSDTRHIPIIFVTAKTEGDNEFKGLSLGAVDYIFKPFNLKILNAKIGTHLKFNAMRDELRQKIDEQQKTIETLKQDILDGETEMHTQDEEKTGHGGGQNSYIEQERNNLVNIINTLQGIVSIQDGNNKIIWANKSAMETFGATFSDLLGKVCYQFYYGRDRPCEGCFFEGGSREEGAEPVKIFNEKFDTSFLQTNIPLYDTGEKLIGVACTAQSMGEAMSPVTALGEQELSGAMGEFLDNNFSEINEVLSTLLVSSDAISNMYKDDKNVLKLNDYIADASNRLRVIFSELRKQVQAG